MRRLVGYTYTVTETTVEESFGWMAFSYDDTLIMATDYLLLLEFDYNYRHFAFVAVKPDYELTPSDVTTMGLSLGDNITAIETRLDGSVYRIDFDIQQYILSATGAVKYEPALNDVFVMGDTSSSAKVFTNASGYYAYIDGQISTGGYTIGRRVESLTLSETFEIDIDEQTAIGLDYKAFDLKQPDEIGIKHSNTFTLPRTPSNERLHGNFGISDEAYAPYAVDYIVDNHKLIDKGRIEVSNVGQRISCTLIAKDSVWDEMGKTLWPEFMQGYFEWLATEHPTAVSYSGDLSTVVASLKATTEHVKLSAMYSELDNLPYSEANLYLSYFGIDGGHMAVFCKSLFQYVQERFGISFFGDATNSIFGYKNPYIKEPSLEFVYVDNTESRIVYSSQQKVINRTDAKISEYISREKRSVLDFIRYFIQHTNSVMDRLSATEYAIRPFDLITDASVVDYSGLIEDSIEFEPILPNIGRRTTIDFVKYSELIEAGSARIDLVCENYNAPPEMEFYKIGGYIPAAYVNSGLNVLAFVSEGGRSEFTLLEDSGNTTSFSLRVVKGFMNVATTQTLPVAQVMAVPTDGLQEIIRKPKLFRIRKWLDIDEVDAIRFWAKYWVVELGGCFYLNSVKGFNPYGSKQPTEIELMLIDRQFNSQLDLSPTAEWGGFVCELETV
ncbi:MAG: hypothetical protein WDA42_06900 [Candidatus Bathyarchaeia archaeon]